MNRKKSREKTMRLVFQMDSNGSFDVDSLSVISEDEDVLNDPAAVEALKLTCENIDEIDRVISENTKNWRIERLPKAELAILRLAVCEMLYIDDIPVSVSINEAVELAKRYGEEKSYAFVNSVLGKISEGLK